MAHHTDVETESQVRHVDYVNEDPTLTWVGLTSESESRHVDEYRLAKKHEEEASV